MLISKLKSKNSSENLAVGRIQFIIYNSKWINYHYEVAVLCQTYYAEKKRTGKINIQ